MSRPLERYDPSKGYLDSELEVGNNKHSNASVVSTRGRRTQAAEWQAASKQAKSKNDEQFE